MQEAFTAERLAGYLGPMNATSPRGIDRWPADGQLRFYPAVKQLTLDVATEHVHGRRRPAPRPSGSTRRSSTACGPATAFVRVPVPGLRWSRGLAGRRLLEDYLRRASPAKRAGDGTTCSARCATPQAEDGESFTDDDVVNHMIFLLMAAHDTSTITITTMAYYLATHPEWQERCRAESLALGSEAVGYDDLDELVALDLVMKEALRLVVPGAGRHAQDEPRHRAAGLPRPGRHLRRVHLWGVHHLAECWPDPERFDPERFADDRREDKVHRHAFMPFGNGVHKCIGMYFGGMEIKATMHQLLRGTGSRSPPGYEMPLDWSSLPRPRDGLPVTLHRL